MTRAMLTPRMERERMLRLLTAMFDNMPHGTDLTLGNVRVLRTLGGFRAFIGMEALYWGVDPARVAQEVWERFER